MVKMKLGLMGMVCVAFAVTACTKQQDAAVMSAVNSVDRLAHQVCQDEADFSAFLRAELARQAAAQAQADADAAAAACLEASAAVPGCADAGAAPSPAAAADGGAR